VSKLLHVIVACSENRVIGRQGKLPWRIPEDLQYFHDETAGQICVLGRVCYDTWPRVHADGRRPVVLTSRPLGPIKPVARDVRDGHAAAPVVLSCSDERQRLVHSPVPVPSLAEALTAAEALPGEIFICGGQRIYEETFALQRPLLLHLTLIHATIEGDTFFPEWRHLPSRLISSRASGDAHYRYTFQLLELFTRT
jgi:dihydrofolate reductase